MQWRMVGRRGRAASWTIVGDPAQSSWPVPAEAAAARAAALEGKEIHEFHLSTNYRNSAEIYEYAAAYADRVGLDADLPTAVRSTGVAPREVTGVTDLEAATREAVASVARQVEGTVGVVVPVARRSDVNAWLASWPELAADAPGARAAIDSSVDPLRRRPHRRPHRPRHQGPGVRRHRRRQPGGDRGRVRHRHRHPLRRPHPRHPAPHRRLLSARFGVLPCSSGVRDPFHPGTARDYPGDSGAPELIGAAGADEVLVHGLGRCAARAVVPVSRPATRAEGTWRAPERCACGRPTS